MPEPQIEPVDPPITGGCQCGAVRYAIDMKPVRTHYCHCRMCQRAVGNVFAALAGALKDRLRWTARPPRVFRSSSLAERGFCPDCGTPLSFAYDAARWIYVTVGSLDEPAIARPEVHFGVESQLPWLHIEDRLPREMTQQTDALLHMQVFQR